MACDILFSTAWQCGDNDCGAEGGWHKSDYWIDGRGYTVDNYSDGDHESVRKRDMPSQKEVDAGWREYSQWVLTHGVDPLSEFIVAHEKKLKRKYSATFVDSIGGLMLVKVRTAGGKIVPLTKMPDDLQSYLNVEAKGRNWYQRDATSIAAVVEAEWGGCKVTRRLGRLMVVLACDVVLTTPRSKEAVAADLRKIARRHLRREKGGTA
jgi:hypothetical protein